MVRITPDSARLRQFWKKVREKPSPTCRDPRQLDLVDHVKAKAFAKLDEAIKEKMGGR